MGGGSAACLGTSSAWVSSSRGFFPPDLRVMVPRDVTCFGKPSIVLNEEFGFSLFIKLIMPFASPVDYEVREERSCALLIWGPTFLLSTSLPEARVLPWPGFRAVRPGARTSLCCQHLRQLSAFWMLCFARVLGCPSPLRDLCDSNCCALPVDCSSF